jgi:hypothetical protein
MSEDPTLTALWQSVAALPECRTRRGILADRLMELGREDEAEAVRETTTVVPTMFSEWWYRSLRPPAWSISFHRERPGYQHSVPLSVWKLLRGVPSVFSPSWRDYPTCLAALRDLVRATVEVNREGVTA